MKKGSKPVILKWSGLLSLVAIIILVHVYLKLQNESLVKAKTLAAEEIKNEKNIKINLYAHLEQLSAEDRITALAYELGLVKDSSEVIVVRVDKNNVEELTAKINSKYE